MNLKMYKTMQYIFLYCLCLTLISSQNLDDQKEYYKRFKNPKLSQVIFSDYKSFKKEYDRLYSLATRERRKELYKDNKENKKKRDDSQYRVG